MSTLALMIVNDSIMIRNKDGRVRLQSIYFLRFHNSSFVAVAASSL